MATYRQVYQALKDEVDAYYRLEGQKDELDKKLSTIDESLQFSQQFSKKVQDEIHNEFSSLVTYAIQQVFECDYRVELRFSTKASRTVASIVLVDAAGNEYDPMTSNGGGFVDVISFCFRVIIVSMHHRLLGTRMIMLLDEPFRMVSKQYRNNVRELLVQLSQKLGMQFIYVTHDESLIIDQCIQVRQKSGKSYVEKV